MKRNTILLVSFVFLNAVGYSLAVTYDVYLQLMQFQTGLRMTPYRVYELRWEVECTTDDRHPITKFPTAFSMDDTHLVFFDSLQLSQKHQQDQVPQNFVYVRDVAEMAVICFRLYYRNDLALEDCLVVDVRSTDFSDVRYSTTTRAHGNALTYQAQITPSNGLYMLLLKKDDNETLATNSTANNSFSPGCIAATAIASVEGFFILAATVVVLCLCFLKTGRFSFGMLKRKRHLFPPGRIHKKPPHAGAKVGKANGGSHSKIGGKQANVLSLRVSKTEQHYKAPSATSASSADSGLSTISNSSNNTIRAETKTTPVVIYDDPPEFAFDTNISNAQKKFPVHDYLTELWRRKKPGSAPPPPPRPDYRREPTTEDTSTASQMTNDVYAALEDPNNWDPPEHYVTPNNYAVVTECSNSDAQKQE